MHLVSDRHLEVWHDPQHSCRLSQGCWQVLCDQSGLLVFCQFCLSVPCANKRQFFRSLPDTYEHHCTQSILLVLQVSKTHVSFNQGHAPSQYLLALLKADESLVKLVITCSNVAPSHNLPAYSHQDVDKFCVSQLKKQ